MGFFSEVGRAFQKGIGAVGGFLGDVAGGALQSFSETGLVDPRASGIGRTIGNVIGEAAEVVFGPPEVSLHTGRIKLPTTVPGQFGQIRVGPSAPASAGTSRDIIPLGASRLTRSFPVNVQTTTQPQVQGPPMIQGPPPSFGPPEIAERILFPTVPGPQGVQLLEELALQIPRGVETAREFFRGLFQEKEAKPMGDVMALPGGAPVPSALDVPGLGTLCRGTSPFVPTMAGMRPARVFALPNPATGAVTFFGHLGRPLLFSRDMSAARKVDKLARRARRTRRGR